MNFIRFSSLIFFLGSYQACVAFWPWPAECEASSPTIASITSDDELRKALQNKELRMSAIKHLKEDIDACDAEIKEARKRFEEDGEKKRELQLVAFAQIFVFCKEFDSEKCESVKKSIEEIGEQVVEQQKKLHTFNKKKVAFIAARNNLLVRAYNELSDLEKKIDDYRAGRDSSSISQGGGAAFTASTEKAVD